MANFKSSLIPILFLTLVNLLVFTTAIPIAENDDKSFVDSPTKDLDWFAADTLPEGVTLIDPNAGFLINITAPTNTTILSRGNPLANYLKGLKGTLPYDGPYCTKSLDGNTCTFATRVGQDGNTVDLFAFDNWCNRIGYWTNIPFPIKDFSFFSELPYSIVATQVWQSSPPWMWYGGRASGYGYSQTWCYNGGSSNVYPGFRLACRTNFGRDH